MKNLLISHTHRLQGLRMRLLDHIGVCRRTQRPLWHPWHLRRNRDSNHPQLWMAPIGSIWLKPRLYLSKQRHAGVSFLSKGNDPIDILGFPRLLKQFVHLAPGIVVHSTPARIIWDELESV